MFIASSPFVALLFKLSFKLYVKLPVKLSFKLSCKLSCNLIHLRAWTRFCGSKGKGEMLHTIGIAKLLPPAYLRLLFSKSIHILSKSSKVSIQLPPNPRLVIRKSKLNRPQTFAKAWQYCESKLALCFYTSIAQCFIQQDRTNTPV